MYRELKMNDKICLAAEPHQIRSYRQGLFFRFGYGLSQSNINDRRMNTSSGIENILDLESLDDD